MSELKIPESTFEGELSTDAHEVHARFLNIRPSNYVSDDAQRVSVRVAHPTEKNALRFSAGTNMHRYEDDQLRMYVLWKFNGIQSVDYSDEDPYVLTYYVDADYDAELLQKELLDELCSIRATRQSNETLLAKRLRWHDEYMRQLGARAISHFPNAWHQVSQQYYEAPRNIEPYREPDPTPIYYGSLRPVGYKTDDAQTVKMTFETPEHTMRFLTSIVWPLSVVHSDRTDTWAQWGVYGLQSLDMANSDDMDLQFFLDANLDKEYIAESLLLHQIATILVDGLAAGMEAEMATQLAASYVQRQPDLLRQTNRLWDRADEIMQHKYKKELKKVVSAVRLNSALLALRDKCLGKGIDI